MHIGDKIRKKRNELKWSQRELARRMNYTDHSTITRIEKGSVDVTQSRIVQFAEVLGVSIGYLMGWEEAEQKNDAIADIVVRMRTDEKFLSAVIKLNQMESEQLSSLLTLLK